MRLQVWRKERMLPERAHSLHDEHADIVVDLVEHARETPREGLGPPCGHVCIYTRFSQGTRRCERGGA